MTQPCIVMTTTASLAAQDQLATLMADAMPEQVLSFKFDNATQERIQYLVGRKQTKNLNNISMKVSLLYCSFYSFHRKENVLMFYIIVKYISNSSPYYH